MPTRVRGDQIYEEKKDFVHYWFIIIPFLLYFFILLYHVKCFNMFILFN